ncbi:MAG: NADH-quinone oxidoreductase subunit N [Chloroflexi bacterium]|uniref:NADH-quinone oxidoreductase subunit N n=1 Tax=Candidatus Chlorohelix allophototropha TaxID=3003348 RepID=A0A8T7LS38_9CHLR|nr:NADH-quinone oxidoreductase subunit N [Chloroflexota bacterium]WJW66716.1 NADH-quinone oxidoreductase subunit N [Chloroflexota bacterium L227-S17]
MSLESVVLQISNVKPSFTGDDFIKLLPELIVLLSGTLITIIDMLIPKDKRPSLGWLALIGYSGALVAAVALFNYMPPTGVPSSSFGGMFIRDNFTTFLEIVFLISAILSVLIAPDYVLKRDMPIGDFYNIQSSAVLGMMVTAAAGDLTVIFVGIELISISVYILTGFARNDKGSAEGALKYFLLGIIATAILVYGMAWLFGMTGSTNLNEIRQAITATPGLKDDPGLTFAMLLLLVGFGFKIAAVPFHIWTPDAYEGAPTPITAFMSTGPKAAAFAAMVRVMVQGIPQLSEQWTIVIAVLAVLTMTLGNLVAIVQKSVKRMLAYSSIAHTGYIMIGLAAYVNSPEKGRDAIGSILLYSVIYVFMNMGAFGIAIWLQNTGNGIDEEDYNGLGSWAPIPALAMAVCLFSLTGLPPTGGFFGKFFVFRAAIDSDLTWLVIIGALNSAVSAFFYLRIIVAMYFRPAPEGIKERAQPTRALFITTALVLITAAILILGIYPGPALDWARDGATPFFEGIKTAIGK